MEALWNLEDRFKVSTKTAIALCVCTSSLLIAAVCVVAGVYARRRAKIQEPPPSTEEQLQRGRGGGEVVKKVLMKTVRWSQKERYSSSPLLLGEVGWQSNNSESPVWQRPILMGEKCELPRFSGLILYDDTGRPLHNDDCDNISASSHHHHHNVDMTAMERVSLKDLFAH